MRTIKNVLVTGGSGFIGSHFIDRILKEKQIKKVVNLDSLTYASNLNNVKEAAKDSRYLFIKGSILDEELIRKIFKDEKIDTVVHFAAETHVDNSIFAPSSFIETNIKGTFTLLEAVRGTSIHFHHISTDEVYGSLKEGGYFTEESQYRPNSPYSASKAASDHLVRSYGHTYDISYTMSHSTNNFGPRQHEEKLLPLMIKKLILKKPLPIYGDGKNVRDWLYVEDHVDAIFSILRYGKRFEVYDIGGDNELSNIELIKLLISFFAEETNSSKKDLLSLISFVKDRPGHDFRYAINSSKIKKELGFKPKHSFEEGVRKTIRSLTLS